MNDTTIDRSAQLARRVLLVLEDAGVPVGAGVPAMVAGLAKGDTAAALDAFYLLDEDENDDGDIMGELRERFSRSTLQKVLAIGALLNLARAARGGRPLPDLGQLPPPENSASANDQRGRI